MRPLFSQSPKRVGSFPIGPLISGICGCGLFSGSTSDLGLVFLGDAAGFFAGFFPGLAFGLAFLAAWATAEEKRLEIAENIIKQINKLGI